MLGLRGEPMREAPMTSRRFPPPWQVEQTPGGFKVLDANGQGSVLPANARRGAMRASERVGANSTSTALFPIERVRNVTAFQHERV
jgi:hypothetical protein